MWKQNEEKLMRPHAEPWHPETLPLDLNPVVYPVAKARRKGSLPGRSGATQDCKEGIEGLDLNQDRLFRPTDFIVPFKQCTSTKTLRYCYTDFEDFVSELQSAASFALGYRM